MIQAQHKMMVIGHRGAMGHITENTLPSIQKALDLKVDMIEIDVFIIKSGEVVVFHDDTLDNLTNAKGPIEAYTWQELQNVLVKGNYKIPLLDDVISLINKKVPLNIELKGNNTAIPVANIIKSYYKKGWCEKDFIISSFLWKELEIFRTQDAKTPIAILTEEDPLLAISIAKKIKAIAINPWYKTLSFEVCNKIKQEGFKIFTYTVNDVETIATLKSWKVDGIFCDYPERGKK